MQPVSTDEGSPNASLGAETVDSKTLSCLLIDDSAADLLSLKSMIESAGHLARATQNPTDVEAELSRRTYDAVFLDIVMPERNGYSVLRAIRSNYPDLPVFMVSSKSGDSDLNWAALQGASGYLIKPYSWSDLARCLGIAAAR